MASSPINSGYSMFIAIVNFGVGSKILKEAKKEGVSGGTIFLGKGTAKNHILEVLGLDKVKKEVVLMASCSDIENKVHDILTKKFALHKPNHGILFSIQVNKVFGSRICSVNSEKQEGGSMENIKEKNDYEAIFTIVDRGNAEDVIEAASAAGAQGGTIVNGRGSGVHENSQFFGMTIEPEKEIVIILIEKSKTNDVVTAIREKVDIDEPGKGIVFTIDVNKTSGLVNMDNIL